MSVSAKWRAVRHPSLSQRLMLAALAVAALLIGLDLWRTWQARGREIANAMSETANLARSLAEHTHGLVQAADARRADGAGGDGTFPVELIERFYAKFSLGRDGTIALLSDGGAVIAYYPAAVRTGQADISGQRDFRNLQPFAPAGDFKLPSSPDGVARLGSYRRVDDYPLVVVVAHGVDQVLAIWRAQARLYFLVTFAVASMLVWLASRLASHVRAQQAAERHFRLLAENSGDAVICFGLDGRRLYASPAFTAMTGWSIEEGLTRNFGTLVHADDRYTLAPLLDGQTREVEACFRYICKDGSHLWAEARLRLVEADAGEEPYYLANVRDISQRRSAEDRVAALKAELAAQAITDDLTGLFNRRRFDEALEQEWRRAARDATPLSLLLVDVDRFKLYNDCHGHLQGDQCLRDVAKILAECARRPADMVARYGGEEIVVLLPGADIAGASALAERMRAAVEAAGLEHVASPPRLVVTVSIGIATMFPRADQEAFGPEDLVAAANGALNDAKRNGRNLIASRPGRPLVGQRADSDSARSGLSRRRRLVS